MKATKIELSAPGIRLEMDEDDARCLASNIDDALSILGRDEWKYYALMKLRDAIREEMEWRR